jgi:hypothetical protein
MEGESPGCGIAFSRDKWLKYIVSVALDSLRIAAILAVALDEC